jgi:hypothetical protein
MEEKRKNFKIFNFNEAYQAPQIKYNPNRGIIEYGKDNNYPAYILDIYNFKGSSIHKSIVNKKVKLSVGNGFMDILDPALKEFVKKNKLEKEIRKASLDYELFNGFCFELIWDREGVNLVSLKHIPFHKIRIGIKNEDLPFDHYWFCNDWTQYRKAEYSPEWIRSYNPLVKQGKQLYYYSEYNPSSDGLYPIIGYSTTMNWIEADFQVSQFHLNQLKQGFTPSFILNFATGIPTDEEMDEYYREFKKNYQGTENSGKIIITYSQGQDEKPELIPIQLNDSDDRFIMLKEQISENIVQGHEIPPQLVILTPGKLGSTEEREELMKEFQNSYITPRQEVLEEVLNDILSTAGFGEELKLKEYNSIDNKEINPNTNEL